MNVPEASRKFPGRSVLVFGLCGAFFLSGCGLFDEFGSSCAPEDDGCVQAARNDAQEDAGRDDEDAGRAEPPGDADVTADAATAADATTDDALADAGAPSEATGRANADQAANHAGPAANHAGYDESALKSCGAHFFQDRVGGRLIGSTAQPPEDGKFLRASELPRPHRIVPPNAALTQDYRPKRINVFLNNRMQIDRITCG